MFQKYKKTLILTSALTLLPIPVQLLLGRDWGVSISVPLILLAAQWFCFYWTMKDPGNQKQNRKPMMTVLWILPILSNVCCGIDYALASGTDFPFASILFLLMGAMFAIIGNYLPKVKMNSTLGIKIPWAYTSEENWNATHRFGGKVWVSGGIGIMLGALLPEIWAFTVLMIGILVLCIVPTVYSYRYYKMQKARGDALVPFPPMANTKAGKIPLILLAVVLIGTVALMFTGDIEYRFEEDYFVIEADFYDDQVLFYDVIDSVIYRDTKVPGTRVWGYGSGRLLMGTFQNEEYGNYTRYTYTTPQANIIVHYNGDRVLVLGGETSMETMELYNQLMEKLK